VDESGSDGDNAESNAQECQPHAADFLEDEVGGNLADDVWKEGMSVGVTKGHRLATARQAVRPMEEETEGRRKEAQKKGRTEDVENHQRDVVLRLGNRKLEIPREPSYICVTDGGAVDEVEKEQQGALGKEDEVDFAKEAFLCDRINSEGFNLCVDDGKRVSNVLRRHTRSRKEPAGRERRTFSTCSTTAFSSADSGNEGAIGCVCC
jgi:hypothetical protein